MIEKKQTRTLATTHFGLGTEWNGNSGLVFKTSYREATVSLFAQVPIFSEVFLHSSASTTRTASIENRLTLKKEVIMIL